MKPTTPGWYWYRNTPRSDPEVVRVEADGDKLYIVTEAFDIYIHKLTQAVWGPKLPIPEGW